MLVVVVVETVRPVGHHDFPTHGGRFAGAAVAPNAATKTATYAATIIILLPIARPSSACVRRTPSPRWVARVAAADADAALSGGTQAVRTAGRDGSGCGAGRSRRAGGGAPLR